MKNSLLILMLVLITACNQKLEVPGVEAKIFNQWIGVSKATLLTPEYFNTDKTVTSPPMVWRPLVETVITANEAKDRLKQCLFYRVPHKKSKGILKVVSIKPSSSCSYMMDIESELAFATLDDVEDLQLYFSKASLLTLKFKVEGTSYNWKFPFYNIKKHDPSTPFELYSSHVKNSAIQGVSVWPTLALEKAMSGTAPKLLGSYNDSYPDKTLVACHKVDSNCKSLSENSCGQCKYGFFEVAGSQCAGGGTKFCGPNRCGEKGWPACKRGLNHMKYPVEPGCYPDSPAGFCREGLRVICDANKVLVCN